jgi:glycosidase
VGVDPAGRAAAGPPEAIANAQATFAFVQKLVAIRRAHAALAVGGYAEMWRPNGSTTQNVLAFLRDGGGEQLVFVANGGTQPATVTLMLRGRIADGTTLSDLFGASPDVTAGNGTLAVTLSPKTAALYRPQ